MSGNFSKIVFNIARKFWLMNYSIFFHILLAFFWFRFSELDQTRLMHLPSPIEFLKSCSWVSLKREILDF